MARPTVNVELTAAVVHGERIVGPGAVIECSHAEAKNLAERGRARLGVAPAAPQPRKRLARHSLDELRDIAEDYGLVDVSSLKKAELIAAIEASAAE